MDLDSCRWDVLGRTEEVLAKLSSLFELLHPAGELVVTLTGEPLDYLAKYLTAFEADVRELPLPGVGGNTMVTIENHDKLVRAYSCVKCTAANEFPAVQLGAVVRREIFDERSHKRYADALDDILGELGASLSILDVGGGDGHMAEWWAACGHKIHVLEVDEAQAKAAKMRLGADRVTLHDGRSAWPYQDKSFDVCLLLFVLHHIHPQARVELALSEAARVAKKRVLVLEDQPRDAPTAGLRRLAVAVTAEHFRPFGQDPQVYMRCVRPDGEWRRLFLAAGLRCSETRPIAGTLQHPVPHALYVLDPLIGQ